MKPAQIRVFDGLRITTAHLDHLQASFHSGLEDIREVLGLGRVHRGLEVTAEESAITVAPGLAFDHEGNRIVCDEPKRVEVLFTSEDQIKFVCLKREQVEGGEVEGQATLVWDSGAVELRDALPETKDNLVPIARIRKKGEGIEVLPLEETAPSPAPEAVAPKLWVKQGVARLASSPVTVAAAIDDPAGSRADQALAVDAMSVTAHSILKATLKTEGEGAGEKWLECSAQGEAVVEGSTITQFGLSAAAWRHLSETALARLPLAAFDFDALKNAALLLRLERSDEGKLRFAGMLEWDGAVTAEAETAAADAKASLAWEAAIGWKAFGQK
jgi:hypothetical protein